MTTNKKFQLSRNLFNRIHSLCNDEPREGADNVERGYLLGFDQGTLTTVVGISKDPILYHANLSTLGVFYTKPDTNLDECKKLIDDSSQNTLCETNKDKLHLIYGPDEQPTGKLKTKYYCAKTKDFVKDCDLNIAEDSKVYAHSAIASIEAYIKLNIFNNKSTQTNVQEDAIEEAISEALDALYQSCHIQLDGSSLKIEYPSQLVKQNGQTEDLYDSLNAPDDIKNSGDYLPNMTKKDLEKLIVKWRNKEKTQRTPLKFRLLLGSDLSSAMDDIKLNDEQPKSYYIQHLMVNTYIHMKDPLSKTLKTLVRCIGSQLNYVRDTMIEFYAKDKMPFFRPGSYNFKTNELSHFIPVVYALDESISPELNTLARRTKVKEIRRKLHENYFIPADRPTFRIVNQFKTGVNADQAAGYLCNVHLGLDSGIKGGLRRVIQGTYTYHHYMQDGKNDNGWGCAYRSLQTIVSWFKHQGYLSQYDNTTERPSVDRVPTHDEIQQALVEVGDKQKSFLGSSQWIGSQEVCYVFSHLYGIESKIMAVSSGSELVYKARELAQHFEQQSTPVMIGGGVLAHTIIGIDFNEKNGDVSYLILDPHYTGAEDLSTIQKKGWCGWKKSSFWDKTSFYNLCMPLRPNDF